jgi:hypothetical protein
LPRFHERRGGEDGPDIVTCGMFRHRRPIFDLFLPAGGVPAGKILLDPSRPLFRLLTDLIFDLLQIRATSIESKIKRRGN